MIEWLIIFDSNGITSNYYQNVSQIIIIYVYFVEKTI